MIDPGTRAALRVFGLTLSLLVFGGVAGAVGSDPGRVSIGPGGAEANGSSGGVNDGPLALSADGRFVVFTSTASNLVSGDTNVRSDVFVRDRQSGVTERVSVSNSGEQGSSNSGPVNGDSLTDTVDISSDGRYVAFTSYAGNLVPSDSNGVADVFVRDRQSHVTERVSVGSGGAQASQPSYAPSISADGRYVAFVSGGIWVRDRQAGTTVRVDPNANSPGMAPSISANGRFVAFASDADNLVANDVNDSRDVFVRDLQSGLFERVSVSSAEAEGLSASTNPDISADGRFVAFSSLSGNLVPNDGNGSPDVFVRDRQLGTTERVSVNSAGEESFNGSAIPNEIRISGSGRYVVFDSDAAGLAPNDPNTGVQVFVRDREAGTTIRVSEAPNSVPADGSSFDPGISSDGSYVAFESDATNLVVGDGNGVADVFAVRIGGSAGTGADLEVTQQESADPTPVQGPVTYTLTVRNLGPEAATSVVLTNTVPSGVTAVTAQPAAASTRGRVLTFNLGSLAAGASATVTVRVTPRQTGRITNVARVESAVQDPNAANNQATETTSVERIAPPPPQLDSLTVTGTPNHPTDPPGPVVTLKVRGAASATFTVQLTGKPKGKVTVPVTVTGPGLPATTLNVRISGRDSGTARIDFGPTAAPGDYQASATFNGVTRTAEFKVLPIPPLELNGLAVSQNPGRNGAVRVTVGLRRETTEAVQVPVTVSVGEASPVTSLQITVPRRAVGGSGAVRLGVGTYIFTATFGGVTKSVTFQVTR